MCYRTSLVEKGHDHATSDMPTRYILVSVEESKARPLLLNVKIFEKKEEENQLCGIEKWKLSWGPPCLCRSHNELAWSI